MATTCYPEGASMGAFFVTTVDASEWGYGVVAGNSTVDACESLYGVREKWRFKGTANSSQRERALEMIWWGGSQSRRFDFQQQGCEDPPPGLDPPDSETFTHNVPITDGVPLGIKWHVIRSVPWRFKEHISLLEARAVVKSLTWLLSLPDSASKRHVSLTDSLGVALAFERGRSSKTGVCQALRAGAALILSHDVAVQLRWVPSETAGHLVVANNSTATGAPEPGHAPVRHCGAVRRKQACQADIFGQGQGDSAQEEATPSTVHSGLDECVRVRRHFREVPTVVGHHPRQSQRHESGSERYFHHREGNRLRDGDCGSRPVPSRGIHLPSDCLQWHLPQFSRWGKKQLPDTKQSLAGFNRLAPPCSRLPLPMECDYLLAKTMLDAGHAKSAVLLMVATFAYLLPEEATSLVWRQVILPTPQHPWLTLTLHPEEHLVASKTHSFNDNVMFDLDMHQWLIRPLTLWKGQSHANDRVGEVDGRIFNLHFQRAVRDSQLHQLGPLVPYVARHSGASHDLLHGLRDVQMVQKRGRWMSPASLRRYAKGGRLAEQWAKLSCLSSDVQERAVAAESALMACF
eukprot:6490908-Amphidinium_carterae.4